MNNYFMTYLPDIKLYLLVYNYKRKQRNTLFLFIDIQEHNNNVSNYY